MKKQYIDPITEIIAVTPNVILSASTPDVTIDDNEEDAIDADKVETRRRKDIWEDGEEEEEQ